LERLIIFFKQKILQNTILLSNFNFKKILEAFLKLIKVTRVFRSFSGKKKQNSIEKEEKKQKSKMNMI